MKIELTEQDLGNIGMWYGVFDNERATDTDEIGTLLKLGIKTRGIHGSNNSNKFRHDCQDCILIGLIEDKFNCSPEGFFRNSFSGNYKSEREKIEMVTSFMNEVFSYENIKQIEEYLVEFNYKDGVKSSALLKKVDIVKLDYPHHDVYYCLKTGSLIMRYGNKGEEYYSGKPEVLKQVLEEMKKKEPTFPLIKIYERGLEIFAETGIEVQEAK